MKEIHLVRHAKSDWAGLLPDISRPLCQRGIDDALLVSQTLKKDHFQTQAIFASPSIRTQKTAAIFINELNLNHLPFSTETDLYDFSGEMLIKTLQDLDQAYDNVLIFGHNHAVTYFVNTHTDDYFENIPTCGYVHLRFSVSRWKDLEKGVLLRKFFPKELTL